MPLIQLLEVLIVVGVLLCPAVAAEPVHSHAGIHQVNSEWSRGHRRGSVADEYFWTFPLAFPDPRWDVKQVLKIPMRKGERVDTSSLRHIATWQIAA
jgi:hypothetical protein